MFPVPVQRAAGDDLDRYEVPARGARGRAAAVVLPGSLDEVRDVVRAAHEARARLLPQGANTGLVGASTPTPAGDTVVVSLDRLANPIEIDEGGRLAVVWAGTRLSALNEAAAGLGAHLPVDLSADPSIGGMIATNTGGSRVMRYGPMRHHVLAVEAVAADRGASVIGGLGRVRKDSRGISPADYLVGSGGTLAIVTRAVLALAPVPRRTEVWWLALDHPSLAADLYGALSAARPGALSAFEFVSRAALERTVARDGAPPNPFGSSVPAAAVLAEWSALDPSSLDGIEEDVAAVHEAGLIADGRAAPGAAAWGLRHRITDSLRAFGIVLGHDVSAPLGRLMALREEATRAVAAVVPHAVMCDFGHLGDGGLHLNVLVPTDVEAGPDTRAAVRACVDGAVARHGGSYSAEHGLGPLNADRWLATTGHAEQRAIAGLKAALDPRRILGHPGHPYNRI